MGSNQTSDSAQTMKNKDKLRYIEKETDRNERLSRRKKAIEIEMLETEMLTGVPFDLSMKPVIGAPSASGWTYASDIYHADDNNQNIEPPTLIVENAVAVEPPSAVPGPSSAADTADTSIDFNQSLGEKKRVPHDVVMEIFAEFVENRKKYHFGLVAGSRTP